MEDKSMEIEVLKAEIKRLKECLQMNKKRDLPCEIVDMIVEWTNDIKIARVVGSRFMVRKLFKKNVEDVLNEYIDSFKACLYYPAATDDGRLWVEEAEKSMKEEIRKELFGMSGLGVYRINKYEQKYISQLDSMIREESEFRLRVGWEVDSVRLFDKCKRCFMGLLGDKKVAAFGVRFEGMLWGCEDFDEYFPQNVIERWMIQGNMWIMENADV